ncbi:MAG: chemotaxis protein CheW [Gammaproteobacteria bacterium]|nr:chemotaxis protein CheW [Gammaproteobacteria bacterium]
MNSKPEKFAAPTAAGAPTDVDPLRVRLSGRNRVVPLTELDAVIDCPALSQVPAAPVWLLGVAGYKGRLLPVVDLATVCGDAGAMAPTPGRRLLLLESAVHQLAFSVDEILSQTFDESPGNDSPPIPLRALAAQLLGTAPAGGRESRTAPMTP